MKNEGMVEEDVSKGSSRWPWSEIDLHRHQWLVCSGPTRLAIGRMDHLSFVQKSSRVSALKALVSACRQANGEAEKGQGSTSTADKRARLRP